MAEKRMEKGVFFLFFCFVFLVADLGYGLVGCEGYLSIYSIYLSVCLSFCPRLFVRDDRFWGEGPMVHITFWG